jgi:transcriptional regulator with XRE-family HTH domain
MHNYSIIAAMDSNNKVKELQELSKRIRNARKDAHLSQAALAYAIGVSDKSVSAYEQGRSQPPFEKLKKIAQCTHRPVSYFTEEETNESTIVAKLHVIEQELEEIKKLLNKSTK